MGIRTAIKEWSGVVDALGTGQQVVMVRKYAPPVEEFLLYPTFTYCNTYVGDTESFDKKIQSEFRKMAQDSGERTRIRAQKSCLVDFEYYAKVYKTLEIGDQSAWSRLTPFYIWTKEHVCEYAKQAKKGACLLWLLRVYKLPGVIEIGRLSQGGPPNIYRHHEDIQTRGATPVLTDSTFDNKIEEIFQALGPRVTTR